MIEYYQVPIGYSFFSCGVVISILVYFSMLLFSFIVPIYQYLMLKNCKHYVEAETICNVGCCEIDWSERALKLAKVYLKFSAFSHLPSDIYRSGSKSRHASSSGAGNLADI